MCRGPNDKAYASTIARIEDYLAMIAQAYQNLSIIIFGDFNHKADSAFTGYARNSPIGHAKVAPEQ